MVCCVSCECIRLSLPTLYDLRISESDWNKSFGFDLALFNKKRKNFDQFLFFFNNYVITMRTNPTTSCPGVSTIVEKAMLNSNFNQYTSHLNSLMIHIRLFKPANNIQMRIWFDHYLIRIRLLHPCIWGIGFSKFWTSRVLHFAQ